MSISPFKLSLQMDESYCWYVSPKVRGETLTSAEMFIEKIKLYKLSSLWSWDKLDHTPQQWEKPIRKSRFASHHSFPKEEYPFPRCRVIASQGESKLPMKVQTIVFCKYYRKPSLNGMIMTKFLDMFLPICFQSGKVPANQTFKDRKDISLSHNNM